MKSVELNTNWKVVTEQAEYVTSLPHDVTASAARDYSCAFGQLNGYVPSARAVFTHDLPKLTNDGIAELIILGSCGYGSVYVNETAIGTIDCYGPARFFIDSSLLCSHNTLKIDLVTSPEMSDKYIGLGIADGVKLNIFDAPAEILYNSLFVKTATVGDKTYADCSLFVYNNSDKTLKLTLDCTALNMRGKRAGKKQRKIFLRADQSKEFTVRVRLSNAYEWSTDDTYVYTMSAKLLSQTGEEVCAAATRFGVVSRALNSRGLYINNNKTLMFGAYLSHADAALGGVSVYSNEVRRLTLLKEIGYNAVHFVGCPTTAALDACDDVGMLAFVDVCDRLIAHKAPLDGVFNTIAVDDTVKVLRNHPSVALYGVADDVPECYNRNNGHELIKMIADGIKATDDTRPVTVSAREFVPTALELEKVGCKKYSMGSDAAAISAGREHDLFDKLTAGAFELVDVCGFNYLDNMYESEKAKRNRIVVGARTSSLRAFESLDATEKNDSVIGDFNECGIDYPGGGKLNEILNTLGDIDAIGCEKPQAVYKRILLGARNVAYITVSDPETDEPVSMWNWPRHLGQRVNVKVYTSGDVVALYLDGRLLGRKLAGKINRHIASFSVDYYPGTLEAVAYFKGVECARTSLKSAGSPKTVRLSAFDKNLSVARGDFGFVTVEVCDKDGTLVPYAMRNLTASVTGGELVAFINADPMLRKTDFDTCPAFNGRALAVIRPDPAENKAVVKISGDGLSSNRISFKIKN
ncbi:MAG: glycoside hydrolase family 2 protein [Clostridiales bacterium]|nr:glycoside hydrolase family 2 protein [Clostridiales bacterium]